MISAALLSTWLRVNLPVAVLTTLYTNPLTIVPLYILAYKIGAIVTGHGGEDLPKLQFDWNGGNFFGSLPAFLEWIASLGLPLIIGLLLLGCVLAPVSYFIVRGFWRLHVVLAWRQRQRRRLLH